MSWLTDWFRSDKSKVFIKLILKAAKLFFGRIVEDLYELVEKHVKFAENSGKSGSEKYKLAYKGIETELHGTDYPKYLLNLLIEASVLVLNERLNQN